jgi:hypothetical protein
LLYNFFYTIITLKTMLRKILTTVLLLTFYSTNAQQAPIAIVSTNGTTRLTSTLDSAAILAQDNDIIYLPGGTLGGQVVKHFDKKVTVIGVGHNLDSTSATGRTEIIGNIGFVYNGGESSVLDGVFVSNDIYVSTNVKIYRTNARLIESSCGWANSQNIVIDKCIIREAIYGNGGNYPYCGGSVLQNSIIKNSVISAAANFTQNHQNTTYENCIFLTQGSYGIEQASQCTFRNCTFTGITSWGAASNSFFYNNVFGAAGYPPLTDSSNAIGNIVNQTAAGTFVNAPTATYSYANDYLINSSSPALTGGTGGTQIGIYGGASPWVKGNIPPNPHIRTKNVDAATGAGGTLRVRFNVGVQ